MTGLEDRMKRYEAATRYQLVPRSYMLVRLDGRAFHGYTAGTRKPIAMIWL
jgi:tRNA(His) 5'-end guanylyltransferase